MLEKVKANVLVIDDEPVIRDILEMELELGGYTVTTVESAERAFRELKDHRFDLVLTDIRMPGTDGIEVLRKMKEFDNDLEVIVVSGYISDEAEVACLKNGAFECVRKPYKSEVLNIHLERALNKRFLRGFARLNDASQKLTSTLNQPDLIRSVLEECHKLFAAEPVILMIREPNGGGLKRHAFEMSPGISDTFVLTLANRVEETHRPIILTGDLAADEQLRGFAETTTLGGAIVCPLHIGERALGSLLVFRHRKEPLFRASDFRRAVNIASHVSLALENARLYRVIEEMAIRDGLTGLFSRRYLHESMNHQIRRLRRNTGASIACIFIDLDTFKNVNDRWGHSAGDAVLRTVASDIQNAVRHTDIVARAGGDEFVVMLPDTNELGATVVAEKIRMSIENAVTPTSNNEASMCVTASVGVVALSFKRFAQETEVTGLATELIESADQAMYRAKQAGRNRVST
ncbi:MAG: diguanylate cyclase [Deltaproteobacteria bacterium]|nr:diguanylate cyclase [Deltaproteobacteria bacterium]